jgi:hypothetical protein
LKRWGNGIWSRLRRMKFKKISPLRVEMTKRRTLPCKTVQEVESAMPMRF